MLNHTWQTHSFMNLSNSQLSCCYKDCLKKFKSFAKYENHILKDHKKQDESTINHDYHIKCLYDECKKTSADVISFKKHYYEHIEENVKSKITMTYTCIYEGCDYSTTGCENEMRKRVQVHFSRNHLHETDVAKLKRNINSIFKHF